MKHYKRKIEEDTNIALFSPVKYDDAKKETTKVRKLMFIPFYLMRLVLDKDLSPLPCDAFLLLKVNIMAESLTCCKGTLDLICVAGTLSSAGSKSAVGRDRASQPTSVDCLLQKCMRKIVVKRDLEGMIPLSTTSDPMIL